MTIEQDRLISLVEFAQQSARLKSIPASSVTQHNLFALYEHQLQGSPGIRLNISGTETEDWIWLAVERLHETVPPGITSAAHQPWVQMSHVPTDEPKLREATVGASLIAAGPHRALPRADLADEDEEKPAIDPRATVLLADYDNAARVKAQFTMLLPPF